MGQIEYIVGNESILKRMPEVRAWKPFDERVIAFFGKLSAGIIQHEDCRQYPDLMTLAFWLRKSNVQRVARGYSNMPACLGRGLAFHITPGNVALSFAYSLLTGLITGNTNIVRLSSRRFEQADIYCDALRNALKDEPELAERICIIKYPHDKSITDAFSSICHTRIIWGGDNTVRTIRQSPIPTRATEITFANRFSVCVIDADKYLADYDPKKTAHDFYIDTYLTDQNACSSPRIVCWYGENREQAKKVFWNALADEISWYPMAEVTTVNKLLTYCKYAADHECRMTTERDCRIMRVEVKALDRAILDNIGNSGFFYECDISDVREILPICTWSFQTLSCIGFDVQALRDVVLSSAPEGVDRVVPVGRTMDFNFIWDGRDIIREMTRIVSVA